MLTCPRCGTANLKKGRSFSCSGPSLLCHAQPGLMQSKRKHDQLQSQSTCTTVQQQIRAFNAMTLDLSLPTRNPLHSIPSLHHQSSTQNELAHSNVTYDDFNIEFSASETHADQDVNNDSETLQGPIIETCPFQRNTIRLPPDIVFQVHLMLSLIHI